MQKTAPLAAQSFVAKNRARAPAGLFCGFREERKLTNLNALFACEEWLGRRYRFGRKRAAQIVKKSKIRRDSCE
jgi:hypothetical protein